MSEERLLQDYLNDIMESIYEPLVGEISWWGLMVVFIDISFWVLTISP